MNATAHTEQPTGMAAQPPATRMWPVIQKLSRARDAYVRAKDPETRASEASRVSDFVAELRSLADAILEEVHGA
ncbi:MAG: hypothetical protein C0467_01365 [Planctomycetaceae bacterium]|nr:hypothetical protein [Planctomycetaceae bacterium]